MRRVLVVDDDDIVRLAVSRNLDAAGFSPVEADSGEKAISIFREEKPALVLLDLKMPGMDGIATLKELKKIDSNIPVVILTAHGDISSAVKATKLGAYEFVIKPPNYERLILTLKRATEKFELDREVRRLSSEVETSLEYLCGKSEPMKDVIRKIHQIAQSDFSLIIQGETGTGKSFIARYIHNLSQRSKTPLLTVDIGSMPETLVESELFGYEKGAFTGAEKNKKGYFEMANGGTLLIDELQNLSPYVQSKLLMVVEERNITPLGSTCPVKIDVRLIGATNKDIVESVREMKFREDLFYRLNEFMILLPPLRERTEDIPFLAEKFCMEAVEDLSKNILAISDNALRLLKSHRWPGNIRELKNVIRRAVLLSDEEVIRSTHLEFLMKNPDITPENASTSFAPQLSSLNLKELEKSAIKKALAETKGNKTKAAALLHISYMTILRKIKHYSI